MLKVLLLFVMLLSYITASNGIGPLHSWNPLSVPVRSQLRPAVFSKPTPMIKIALPTLSSTSLAELGHIKIDPYPSLSMASIIINHPLQLVHADTTTKMPPYAHKFNSDISAILRAQPSLPNVYQKLPTSNKPLSTKSKPVPMPTEVVTQHRHTVPNGPLSQRRPILRNALPDKPTFKPVPTPILDITPPSKPQSAFAPWRNLVQTTTAMQHFSVVPPTQAPTNPATLKTVHILQNVTIPPPTTTLKPSPMVIRKTVTTPSAPATPKTPTPLKPAVLHQFPRVSHRHGSTVVSPKLTTFPPTTEEASARFKKNSNINTIVIKQNADIQTDTTPFPVNTLDPRRFHMYYLYESMI